MKKPLAPGFNRKEFYPGVTVEGDWGGMRKEGSTSEIPDLQFSHLQNVRRGSGELEIRGGQSKANSVALSGTEVTGIYQDTEMDVGGARVYYMQETITPGVASFFVPKRTAGANGCIEWNGVTKTPSIVLSWPTLPTVATPSVSAKVGNTIVIVTNGSDWVAPNYRWYIIHRTDAGMGVSPLTLMHTELTGTRSSSGYSASYLSSGNIAVIGNNAWFGQPESGTGQRWTRVFNWDLVTATFEETIDWTTLGWASGNQLVTTIGTKGTTLIAAHTRYDSGQPIPYLMSFRTRSAGGVWSAVATPAELVGAGLGFHAFCAVEYGADTYIGGAAYRSGGPFAYATPTIYKWNGTTLTLARELTTGVRNPNLVSGNIRQAITQMISYGGKLWYFYDKNTGGLLAYDYHPCIGSFDGSTWTDVAVNLNTKVYHADPAGTLDPKFFSAAFIGYDNLMYALLKDDPRRVVNGNLIRASTSDPTGAWTVEKSAWDADAWDVTSFEYAPGHGIEIYP